MNQPKGFPPLFEIEGIRWEAQMYSECWAMHIEIRNAAGYVHEHVCVWAYQGHFDEYLVVNYRAGKYVGKDEERWLSPLEAMSVAFDAVARRDSALKQSPSTTRSVRGPMGKATAKSK